ncbi:hypothetical protein D3C87_1275020 [compost metagenome]
MRILAPILSTIMIFLTPGLVLAQEGQATCIGCMALPANPTEQKAQVVRNTVIHDQAGLVTAKVLDYWGIGKACSKFADKNGFGSYAKVINDILTPETHPGLFAGTKDIQKHCKSFPLFDDQQKKNFYTYVTAHLAYAESSCDPTQHAAGPNGRANGLLQLHKGMEQTYTVKDHFITKCRKGDSKNAEKSLRCAMSMLDGQLTVKDEFFARTGYWGPYTPQTRKKVTVQFKDPKRPNRRLPARKMNANAFIKAAIKMYPYCK